MKKVKFQDEWVVGNRRKKGGAGGGESAAGAFRIHETQTLSAKIERNHNKTKIFSEIGQ